MAWVFGDLRFLRAFKVIWGFGGFGGFILRIFL